MLLAQGFAQAKRDVDVTAAKDDDQQS